MYPLASTCCPFSKFILFSTEYLFCRNPILTSILYVPFVMDSSKILFDEVLKFVLIYLHVTENEYCNTKYF